MLSEITMQFHVCFIWGGETAPPAHRQDSSEDTSPHLFPLMKNQSELQSTAANVFTSQ